MINRLKWLRNVAFVCGVIMALGFGTAHAFDSSGCSVPYTACLGEPDPEAFCDYFCDHYWNSFGICNPAKNCCLCYE